MEAVSFIIHARSRYYLVVRDGKRREIMAMAMKHSDDNALALLLIRVTKDRKYTRRELNTKKRDDKGFTH